METELRPPVIIYILGTGHSGSTLLELILSTSPNTFSVGGFRYLDRFIHQTHGVTHDDQGDTALTSPLWSPIAEHCEKYLLDIPQEPILSFKNRLSILLRGKPMIVPHRYDNKNLYRAVQRQAALVTGQPVYTIIDSSKTLARFIEVYQRSEADVYVIHLIRDVRGVVNSNRKLGKSIFASAKYWLTDNIYAKSYLRKQVPPDKQLQIMYESFVNDPNSYIAKINQFTGLAIDYDSLIPAINKQVSYRFAGNGMRQATFTGIRKDISWQTQLPIWWRYILAPLNVIIRII